MSNRFLSEQEIRDVLQYIPMPMCADKRVNGLSKIVHDQQIDVLSSILKTVAIHPDSIPKLGPELFKYFKRAVIDPGVAIGTLASQAVSEPATQGKLKNFTSTGTLRSRSYNADRINEVIAVVSTQRFRNMIIVFDDKNISYERILTEFRPKLVGVTLKKLIANYEVINMNDPNFDQLNTYWWDTYCYIYGVDKNSLSKTFLRIHLDIDKLGAYKITMPMISNAIRAGNNGSFISIISSPFAVGVMDIFVLPGAEISIKGAANKGLHFDPKDVNTFIDNVLIPAVTGEAKDDQEIQVSGIKGIVDINPMEIKIASLLSKILDRSNGIYDIYINTKQEAILGIPRERIKRALRLVGCRMIKVPESEYFYSNDRVQPLFIRCQAPSDPLELLNAAYAELVLVKDNDLKIRDYTNPIYQQLVYAYAEAEGNNLRDVLSIPGIDKNHTISNDLKEVREVLGIQAAYNFIVQELMMVIETLGTRIHQSHVMVIAGSITRGHNLLPVNHQGTSKNLGPFTNMAFERAGETVLAASRGETEIVSSVSSQIGTGRIVISGTGSIDVFQDPEYVEEPVLTSINVPTRPVSTVSRLPISHISSASTTTTPVNPIISALNNASNLSSSVTDLLNRRRQNISNIINTVTATPVVCPLVPISTIEYTYSITDISMPLIENRRSDLFESIAQALGLFDDIITPTSNTATPILTATQLPGTIRPLGRTILPLIRPAAASSIMKP